MRIDVVTIALGNHQFQGITLLYLLLNLSGTFLFGITFKNIKSHVSVWHCWFGICKSIWPVKNWLAWLSVWNEVQMICILIWSRWCYCHPIISCFIKIQIGLTFLVPAYQGCPGKRPLNDQERKGRVFIYRLFAPRYTQSPQALITQFYLQTTPCLPFLHEHSPDGTTTATEAADT